MSNLLSGIRGPEDIKKLNPSLLSALAQEVRSRIIDTVSRTGGHLGASLGVVELTIALHRVFKSPRDKIIWDVGHQSYAHKILTGRNDEFSTLRQHRGLSGFPKRKESPHDPFGTGHSSTSISAAMGFAVARESLGEKYHVVAVIGDGAASGGMSFEALNHAGRERARIIIILNDNGMSISSNVGAMAQYLAKIRTGPSYKRAKVDIEQFLRRIPLAGDSVAEVGKRIKDSLKYLVVPGVLFEELGFVYLGPVDGHDPAALESILRTAQSVQAPCLVHVVTKKGRGYEHAEQKPDMFHGPGPFDPETGEPLLTSSRPTYSSIFGQCMVDLARENPKVVAITAAMTEGTGLSRFSKEMPSRLFDVGIAEQHAVTLAAGLAAAGLRPVVAIYSTFLQRAYDQVNHDVCVQNLPVIFAIDRAGIVGEDGETHQGTFDISFLLPLPNLSLLAPASAYELQEMLRLCHRHDGPCAIRYPRGAVSPERACSPVTWGKAEVVRKGKHITILSVGHSLELCLEAADHLQRSGIEATVVNARFLKPVDWDTILREADLTRALLTVEEGSKIGGFGSLVLTKLNDSGMLSRVVFSSLALPDMFIEHGPSKLLREQYGLASHDIATAGKRIVAQRKPL